MAASCFVHSDCTCRDLSVTVLALLISLYLSAFLLESTVATPKHRIDEEARAAPWFQCGVDKDKVCHTSAD